MKKITQSRWVVTGAGSGIGRLLSLGLAKKGASLILLDVESTAVEKLASEIRNSGGTAHPFVVDVRDLEAMKKIKAEISQNIGRIHGLINNAGIVHGGAFEQTSLDKHFATIGVNTLGVIATTHLFFEDLLAGEDSHLVNIASAAGLIPFPFASTYASSKWSVIGFSESIRLELRERRVTNFHVSTICPGYISTGMFEGIRPPILVPWLDPQKLTDKIIRGIEENRIFIKEPFLVKLIDLQKGILPVVFQDAIYKILGFSKSMTSWRGRN